MTSDFDNLMSIWRISQEEPRFKTITEWLADTCIAEADTKKTGWNFESWKKGKWADTVRKVYGEDALKWEYLNDCHDVLDHKDFHLCVFKPDTQSLIQDIYRLLHGHGLDKMEQRHIKRHLPKLLELMRNFGLDDTDKYCIRLKAVEEKSLY